MVHKARHEELSPDSAQPEDHQHVVVFVDGQTSQAWLDTFLSVLNSSPYAYITYNVAQAAQQGWAYQNVGLALVALGAPGKSLPFLRSALKQASAGPHIACLCLNPSGEQAPVLIAGVVDDRLFEPLNARLCHQQLKLWMQLSAERQARLQAERRKAAAAQARIDALSGLFQEAPSAVVLLRVPDGCVRYQNPEVKTVFGQYLEADGRDWHGPQNLFQRATDGAEHQRLSHFMRAASGESFFNDVDCYQRRDGTVIDIRLHGSPVRDAAGEIVEVLFNFREFTQERRLAAQQAQLVRQLQVLADTSSSHVIMLDPEERYIFANAMHKAFAGSSSAGIVGRRLVEVLGPEVYWRLRAGMLGAFEGTSSASEIYLKTSDGTGGQFSVRWEPLRYLNYVDGRCEGAILYFRDLTALHAAQSEAEQSLQRFRLICEELQIIVYTIDSTRGVRYLNSAWTDYTGRSTTGALGVGWLAAIHPDDVAAMKQRVRNSDEQMGVMEYEFRLQNRAGIYEWHLGRSLPLTLSFADAKAQRVGMIVNIHERRMKREKVEQRLRANVLAGARAQQRWAQERVKVDALQREREAKEDFVAALSHDLRTPLTVVRLGVQRLEHKLASNGALLPIVTRMQGSVVRIDNMIRDFLDVSRVSSGRSLSLEREPCCLIDVVRSAIDELAPLYNGRLQLGGTERAYGMWDHDSMRRLIDNLVGNAIKYGDGTRPITVGLCHEDNNAVLMVHNFGDVIPPEQRAALFERFTRLDGAIERGAEGWGIGLRLVAAIAAAYDGSVQLRSEPNEGTTFSVVLPILANAEVPTQEKMDAASHTEAEDHSKKPSRLS